MTVEQVTEIKNVLIRKTSTVKRAGNLEAFAFMEAQTRLGKLLAFKEIKESGEYKGIPYIDENGEAQTTQNIKEFCLYIIDESVSSLNEELQNINIFGQRFFEKTNHMKLGRKDLRLLRNAPEHERSVIVEKINNEEIDLNDKDAVKELIEDIVLKQASEKNALKKELDEANQTVEAVRENSTQKQQELDEVKEREAKRRFSQTPWKHQTRDLAQGMLEARVIIEQGVNQLTDIFKQITDPDSPLDEKATNYCARSIFSEATNVNDLVYQLTSEVSGLLSGNFKADLDAVEVLQELSTSDE